MANGGTTDTRNWDRAHSDINVLAQRVTGIENSLAGVQTSLQNLADRLATKPTDIWKVIGGVVGLLGLIGAFLYQGKAYIDSTLDRHDREIGRLAETALSKEDFKAEVDLQQRRNLAMQAASEKISGDLAQTRIDLAHLEGASTERHQEYLRDHTALSARVDAIDNNLIKRPEVEAALGANKDLTTLTNTATNNRVDAVISSLNELRRDFGANWTIGDTVRAIEVRLNALQLQPGFVPPPPPK